MFKQHKQRGSQEGFTIIEVLIVLAIAGLILAVVLIAVPNLQRSQRNSARKNEASRILAAANNYIGNNNGNKLTGTEVASIISDSGTLQQFSGLTNDAAAVAPIAFPAAGGTAGIGIVANTVTTDTTPAAPTADSIIILQDGTCGATLGSYHYQSRSLALIYTLEQSGGGRSLACISS